MTFTVLLDLDDTLLGNDIDRFIKGYFSTLSQALSSFVKPEVMLAAMKNAVNGMLTKQTPGGSLENTFDRIFYSQIGIEKPQLIPVIEKYYRSVYPTIQNLTERREEAIELVKAALQNGWKIVIATNPLFPKTAIDQRLRWAGLPTEENSFSLVTTFENSHFCKPNPAYYAEILASLRWPEGPVVMVGNTLEHDILPPESLGIPTYWVNPNPSENAPSRNELSSGGYLKDCLKWLEKISATEYQPPFNQSSALLATLQSTPAVLDTFSSGLALQRWNQRPAPEEWSFTEVLCHLRDVDLEVNIERIKTILTEKNPFIPGVFTDPWVEERKYVKEDGQETLLEFTIARTQLLVLLQNIDNSAWLDPARHAIFGPITLLELVGFIATHDRTHVKQAWDALTFPQK